MSNLITKLFFLIGVILSLSIGIGHAQAQNQKKAKPKPKQTVQDILKKYKNEDRGGGVKMNKFTKLIPDAQMPSSRQVRNVRAIKPPSSMEFFISGDEKEAQLERLVDEQINELYTLSQKFRKSPERGEIWLRLGEVYVEKSKLVQYRQQTELDKKIATWEARGKKGNPPKIDLRESQSYNKKAIQLYEWYANDFPKSKKLDQAYFFLGYNYVEIGQLKKGTNYYERLTRQFPKSPYITESYFALGEYYFENSNWKKAIENYKQVLKNLESRIYPFAMFKIAWAHYRANQPAIAIGYLEQVIDYSNQSESRLQQGGKQVNKIRLASEAVTDLILFYPEAKSYNDAPRYFESIDGHQNLYKNIEKLAYLYTDRGQRGASRHLFNYLIQANPTDAKAFEYQHQIVMNFYSGGNRKVFRQELFDWIANYGARSAWAQSNPSEFPASNEVRETTLKNYILQEHKALQKSGSPQGKKLTKNLYELYLKEFSNSKNTAEMRFFYGELLYDLKEYDKASEQYTWVIQNAPDSPYHSSSVLNQLLSLERSLPDEKDLEKQRGESLEPFALNKEEREFIVAGSGYVNKFPKADKVVDIKFKIGRIYYSHNYFENALASFREIVKSHPKTPFAKYSANLILDIYNLRKDYEGLTKAGEELLSSQDIKASDINMDIKDVVEKARFKEAQDLEVGKKYVDSAKSFEAFSKLYPTSKLANISRFNAAVNYERAGEPSKSIYLYGLFLNSGNKNENVNQRKEARRLLGRTYERTGQLEKATVEFEKYVAENPKDSLTPDLYYNLAVIYTAFKKYKQAIQAYERYYDTSKKANRVDAIYLIGRIYERQGSITVANRYYERFIQNNPQEMKTVIDAAFRVAQNSDKLKQKAKSQEWYLKVISLRKRAKEDVGAREAAESQFILTQNSYQEFVSLRIPANPSQQGAVVQKKLGLLNQLNKDLAQIIRLDVGDFVVASLTLAGQAYEHMSESFYKAPRPKGMNEDESKRYEAEVEKVAAPLKGQALDNYRNAIKKSKQIDVNNNWVLVSEEGILRIEGKPVLFEESIEEDQVARVQL